MRRQGLCRSVMWEPGSFPRMTQGLPSSRGRSANTARALGPSGTARPPVFRVGQLDAVVLDVLPAQELDLRGPAAGALPGASKACSSGVGWEWWAARSVGFRERAAPPVLLMQYSWIAGRYYRSMACAQATMGSNSHELGAICRSPPIGLPNRPGCGNTTIRGPIGCMTRKSPPASDGVRQRFMTRNELSIHTRKVGWPRCPSIIFAFAMQRIALAL